jgi:hypothetical protein
MKQIFKIKGYKHLKKRYSAQKIKDQNTLIIVLLGAVLIGLIIFTGSQLIGQADFNSDSISFVDAKSNVSKDANTPIGTIVLGSPTDTSIVANIIPDKNWEVVLRYGVESGKYTDVSVPYKSDGGKPINIELNGLKPDTQYYYRMAHRSADGQPYQEGPEYKFHTARKTGDSFVFAVQSDAHFDINSSELYKITAKNILNSSPDFLIDVGDKFMTTGYAKSYNALWQRYQKPRQMLSLAGDSAPVFLANGNHDGENGWLNNGRGNNVAIWAAQARKLLFDNPYPNSFYKGDNLPDKDAGLRASYYSWQWGDALFVVLDPFWNTKNISTANSNNDLWNMTLGDEQYNWLNGVLQSSSAKYKFVFAHHILGSTMHGGIYWTKFGEWGGYNKNNTWGFFAKRPGWARPIRQLFTKYHVNIFFQGHDHIFAKEDLNGVAYQEVPQPNSLYGQAWLDKRFTYNGITQPSSGYIRVTVNPANAKVDYVKSYTQNSQTKNQRNGSVSYSYTVYPGN